MAEKYDLLFMTRDIFPEFWQNETNNALCDLLVNGTLQNVNEYFGNYETDYRLKTGYSIQRASLERALNDKFDFFERRIRVDNNEISGFGFVFKESEVCGNDMEMFVFSDSETIPEGANEAYIFKESESEGGSKTSFTVFVPLEYVSLNSEIVSWIERVLILGTNYNINYF